MYSVLEKDIIKSDSSLKSEQAKQIVPYLPLAKRDFQVKVPLEEIVNAVLYKLKTGVQWYQLPVKSLFDNEFLTWQSDYYHYRKCCKIDVLKNSWIGILEKTNHNLTFRVLILMVVTYLQSEAEKK